MILPDLTFRFTSHVKEMLFSQWERIPYRMTASQHPSPWNAIMLTHFPQRESNSKVNNQLPLPDI